MEQVIISLQGDIAKEKKLRDEAMKGKSEWRMLSRKIYVLVANAEEKK